MAKDKYHFAVRKALESDGWKITDDPYFIQSGKEGDTLISVRKNQ